VKIESVELRRIHLDLVAPFETSFGVQTERDVLLVKVNTDVGEGWGECVAGEEPTYSPEYVDGAQHVLIHHLVPRLRNRDLAAAGVAGLLRPVHGHQMAKAAIEMALLDVKGRALGLAVHSLLGGALTREVTLNAWIGTVPPAQAAVEAGEWLRRGFTTAKIKISGAGDEGIARVAAVRAAVGDRLALRVDFNESLSREDAVPFIRRLEPYALTLVEQPIARTDIAGLAEIRQAIGIPLMADESVTGPASLIDIIRREAADIVKVKVMKQGGLTRTRQMIECAAAAGLRVVVGHGFGLTLSTLAEAAVAATSAAVLPGCEAVGPLKMAGDVVTEPVKLDRGVLRLTDAPGLGATLDPDALKRYRVAR
jgi:L-Ala-D/L-Glu epimerase